MAPEENTTPSEVPSELEVLKLRARTMGIEFSNNIGLETLKKKIEARQNELDGNGTDEAGGETGGDETVNQDAGTNALTGEPVKPAPRKKTLYEELYEKQMALVRVRITNLDPKKKDLPGEVFTIANEVLGKVSRYVPYGEVTDDGWHLPYCIYKNLEERRFLNIRTKTDPRTKTQSTESSMAKEFAIEVLPPLTPTELAKLAAAQAAAGSIQAALEQL